VFRKRLVHLIVCIVALTVCLGAGAAKEQYEIKVEWYDPNGRWDIPIVCFQVMRDDPSILCMPFSPLRMSGGLDYTSGKVMAFATGAGPDVTNMWTNQIAAFVEQGFLLPLNEYIGTDGELVDGTPKRRPDGSPDRNGRIDDDEAKWDYWKTLSPMARKIVTFDGTVYSIPARRSDSWGIVYRKDLMREAGFSDEPPADWDAYYRRLQELTRPTLRIAGAPRHFGRHGMYLHSHVRDIHRFLYPWVWSAGGHLVEEGKRNPETGETHWYRKEELDFIDPNTDQSLALEPSQWRVTFTTEPVTATFEFMWRLFHGPWIRDPLTGEPIDLGPADAAAGSVRLGDGRLLSFTPADVMRGVTRSAATDSQMPGNQHAQVLFDRGEIACMQTGVASGEVTVAFDVRPEQLGFWGIPPRRRGDPPVLYLDPHWLGLTTTLEGTENRVKRQKAWTIIASLGSDLGKRMYARHLISQGQAMFLTPEELRLAGMPEYIDEIPEHWLRDYKRILAHRRYEPFNPNWMQVVRNDLAFVIDRMIREPDYDYRQGLADAQHRANNYVMRSRPEGEMRRYRAVALGILVVMVGVIALFVVLLVRAMRQKAAESLRRFGGQAATRSVYRRWLPWLLLVPGLASVAVWAYYPLVRGTAMAFMDFRLMGQHSWVGLDNFINVVLDQAFRESIIATLKYVGISLGLTFVAPIVLAIMLNEIPWFKQAYRTVFFLPQVMSGIVVMMLWREMFDPSHYGLLNQAVHAAGSLFGADLKPLNWLGSTFWAPICVVLPMLWANVGLGSLIYLAALKSVPEDMYEAADIDGAGLWKKIRHITLPTLYPLIVITFVGAFIGCFHQMQNIFVMTGGASGTRVLSLHIWFTAYADLKFGPATATAWILGSMLIGFTVWQLRILRSVEFRRAAEN